MGPVLTSSTLIPPFICFSAVFFTALRTDCVITLGLTWLLLCCYWCVTPLHPLLDTTWRYFCFLWFVASELGRCCYFCITLCLFYECLYITFLVWAWCYALWDWLCWLLLWTGDLICCGRWMCGKCRNQTGGSSSGMFWSLLVSLGARDFWISLGGHWLSGLTSSLQSAFVWSSSVTVKGANSWSSILLRLNALIPVFSESICGSLSSYWSEISVSKQVDHLKHCHAPTWMLLQHPEYNK